jgi:RNA methyltransferase, TrmH family
VAALITSRSNLQVKRWKALAGQRSPACVWVEGEHLVQEVLRSEHTVSELIVCEGVVLPGLKPTVVVSKGVMDAVSQLESPSTCAAVVQLRQPAPALIEADCIVLDGVQDPGNVGTMLRCAWAFGVQHAVLLPGCANAWSMKSLRAGQGAQFFLRVHDAISVPQLQQMLRVPLLVASLQASVPVYAANLRIPCALGFGSEGQGVSVALLQAAAQAIQIPMLGNAESLNVASACAIALYEQQRQRI